MSCCPLPFAQFSTRCGGVHFRGRRGEHGLWRMGAGIDRDSAARHESSMPERLNVRCTIYADIILVSRKGNANQTIRRLSDGEPRTHINQA